MSFRRVTASTASSATASAMTMRAVRLGGRSAITSASGSELEIDEFMRLRRREAARAEEDVPDADQVEREHDAQEAVNGMPFDVVLHTERAIDAEEHTLVEAPEDERPVRAVPEAAERHRREDVPIVRAPSAA